MTTDPTPEEQALAQALVNAWEPAAATECGREGQWLLGEPERSILVDAIAALLASQRQAAEARGREQERAEIADWYQETFCGAITGSPEDEKHARGDCEVCNVASGIRYLRREPREGGA